MNGPTDHVRVSLTWTVWNGGKRSCSFCGCYGWLLLVMKLPLSLNVLLEVLQVMLLLLSLLL